MPLWARGFVIPEVADVHLRFASLLRRAEELQASARGGPLQAGASAMLAQLRSAYVDFNEGLQFAADEAAKQAIQGMRERLDSTRLRGDTGESPHLRDLVIAEPLSSGQIQTGFVGIGLVSELNRAINRNSPGYGPYWRAQEYGTGRGEVPSQLGRIIYGSFAAAGGGDLTPPMAEYAGGGGGPHPVFLTKRPFFASSSDRAELGASGPGAARTGPAGIGTIGAEIQPKRFIAYGADAAAIRWRDRIAAVQTQLVDRLSAIGVP